ncbi:MAG: metalloregulator ArsR/SmtB family transcription factor [Actinomycetota bacterium]|nr:metalloregulator ArsR/SmtB family transcription factor [Actinomycetota bacterium]
MPEAPPANAVAPGIGGPRALADAAELFKVLGAEVRLAIVVELVKAPRSVQELVEALGVRQPLVSQHLRVLRSARLVSAERRDRQRLYRLVDEHVRHIVADTLHHALEHPYTESGSSRMCAR